MNSLIRKLSTGKIVLVLFIITNLVYVLMVAYSLPKTAAHAQGMALLDMMPSGYDLAYVQELFTALGEEGRQTYLYLQLPIDMLYPLLFALCYSLLLVWLIKKIGKQHTRLLYASYLPFIAAAADYLENIGIITLLHQFPDITRRSVEMVSRTSVVKSSSTSAYFVVVLIVLLAFARQKYLKRKTNTN